MQNVYSVTELNRHIRQWLEDTGLVHVEGELSNVVVPASGHVYFTLKDATAQLRCVYFKNRHRTTAPLENGQKKILSGKLSLYEGRGDYQLIVESMQDAGVGDLLQQFEALKLKLSNAGLFAASRKKPLPLYPINIGIITSLSAAALRDVRVTLARRFPYANVLMYPSDVQGKDAPRQLIAALCRANEEARACVLLLVRGGGSFEDLWAFNDEQLAYAIVASKIPVVSGIGHETDFTLADFVADYRAATPTAAAEAATPDKLELVAYCKTISSRLTSAIYRIVGDKKLLLQYRREQLTDPSRVIFMYWQKLDELERRLNQGVMRLVGSNLQCMQLLFLRLHAMHPKSILQQYKARLLQITTQLHHAVARYFGQHKQRLERSMHSLHIVSPLATLDRGYALAMQGSMVIVDASQVDIQLPLELRLAKGQLSCMVLGRTQCATPDST